MNNLAQLGLNPLPKRSPVHTLPTNRRYQILHSQHIFCFTFSNNISRSRRTSSSQCPNLFFSRNNKRCIYFIFRQFRCWNSMLTECDAVTLKNCVFFSSYKKKVGLWGRKNCQVQHWVYLWILRNCSFDLTISHRLYHSKGHDCNLTISPREFTTNLSGG